MLTAWKRGREEENCYILPTTYIAKRMERVRSGEQVVAIAIATATARALRRSKPPCTRRRAY